MENLTMEYKDKCMRALMVTIQTLEEAGEGKQAPEEFYKRLAKQTKEVCQELNDMLNSSL